MRPLSYTLLAIAMAIMAVYMGLALHNVDVEEPALIEGDASVRSLFNSDRLTGSNSSMDAVGGAYLWGRTTAPRFSFDLHSQGPVQQYTTMKQFVWVSVTSDAWLVSFAMLHLQYADILVVQAFRREADGLVSLRAKTTIPLISPLSPWGTQWEPNSTGAVGTTSPGHRVRYHAPPWAPNSRASVTFTATEILFDVQAVLSGDFGGDSHTTALVRLTGAAKQPERRMGLVFPLGKHRPSLVSKIAAAPLVAGTTMLSIELHSTSQATQQFHLSNGLLAMDYTRGLLRRHTVWFWACLSDPHSSTGMHLSAGTYDVDGVSVEASLFDAATGEAWFLGEKITFIPLLLVDRERKSWSITSESVSLVFKAHEGYGGRVNAGVVDVNLDHRWGTFSGSVKFPGNRTIVYDNAPGVIEDHNALW